METMTDATDATTIDPTAALPKVKSFVELFGEPTAATRFYFQATTTVADVHVSSPTFWPEISEKAFEEVCKTAQKLCAVTGFAMLWAYKGEYGSSITQNEALGFYSRDGYGNIRFSHCPPEIGK